MTPLSARRVRVFVVTPSALEASAGVSQSEVGSRTGISFMFRNGIRQNGQNRNIVPAVFRFVRSVRYDAGMSTVSQFRNADSIDVTVGKRVPTLMWEQRIKNKDLAELLGLEATGIGKKLRAEAKFSIEQLVAVAAHLNTSVAYLVGETENPHPGGGGGLSLPELDSNQQPAGYQPVVNIEDWRAAS